MKKKKTAIILISCLFWLAVAVFLASNLFHMGKFRLSALSNRQCAKFLVAQGVTIPEEFSDLDFREWIATVEETPNISNVFNASSTLENLLGDIRDAVNAYYGVS